VGFFIARDIFRQVSGGIQSQTVFMHQKRISSHKAAVNCKVLLAALLLSTLAPLPVAAQQQLQLKKVAVLELVNLDKKPQCRLSFGLDNRCDAGKARG
jgi:hypothetical protein